MLMVILGMKDERSDLEVEVEVSVDASHRESESRQIPFSLASIGRSCEICARLIHYC